MIYWLLMIYWVPYPILWTDLINTKNLVKPFKIKTLVIVYCAERTDADCYWRTSVNKATIFYYCFLPDHWIMWFIGFLKITATLFNNVMLRLNFLLKFHANRVMHVVKSILYRDNILRSNRAEYENFIYCSKLLLICVGIIFVILVQSVAY